MSQEANDLIARTGAKDPCGKLMRSIGNRQRWSTNCRGPAR